MPLLDSDVNDVTMATDTEETFRTRSGSTGLRNFFRKKHKSGDESHNSSRGSSPGTTPGSKVKTLFDAIRPRSKSDAAHAMADRRRASNVSATASGPDYPQNLRDVPYHRNRSADIGVENTVGSPSQAATHRHSVSGSSYNHHQHMTAMGQLLADGNVLSPAALEKCRNQAAFMDKFRSRAYSDPRPRTSALAARNALLQKRVCLMCLLLFIQKVGKVCSCVRVRYIPLDQLLCIKIDSYHKPDV